MRYFRRNVYRIALRNKGSVIGAILIIALGVFIMIAMMDTLWNLESRISAFYREQNLADIFAEVSGISEAELQQLREIRGIREASGRMAMDARISGEGIEGIVSVHLLSYDGKESLNQALFSVPPKEKEDLFLGVRMSEHYRFSRGQRLRLLISGVSTEFQAAGTVKQPDYIYTVPPGGSLVPDGSVYDIAMIQKSRMEALTGSSSLQELGFRLQEGYRYEDVRKELQEALEPYGLKSLLRRADQPSCKQVEGEYGELTGSGTVIPLIFLSISVFMLYVVLKKMIHQDQPLIGTMKAMGMRDGELLSAYLLEGLLIGSLGAVLGALFAGFFGRHMFGIYCAYFNLPDTSYQDTLYWRAVGLILSDFTAVAAVLIGVRDILSITPSMAMRQINPRQGREWKLPLWLDRRLSFFHGIAIRNMLRNPFRAFLILLAVCFPFAMTSVIFSFRGIVREMLEDEFQRTENYDFQLELDHYENPWTLRNLGETLPGTETSEAVCQTALLLKKEAHTEYSMLTGLNAGSELWRIMDQNRRYYLPPGNGIFLGINTAEKLGAKKGDVIRVILPAFSTEERRLMVADVLTEPFGNGEYVSLAEFPRLFGIPATANKLLLRTRKGEKSVLIREMEEKGSRVSWIIDMQKTRESYNAMFGSMYIMMDGFALMSFAAGVILILNISAVSLRERMNEIVTLEVMGASRREIREMLLWELLLLCLAGILLGFPANAGLRYVLERVMMTESYHIRLPLYPGSCVLAALFCLLMSCCAWWRGCRMVEQVQLTDALKARDQ